MMSKMLHQAEVRLQQNDQEDGIRSPRSQATSEKLFYFVAAFA